MQKSLLQNTIYKAILSFVNIVVPLLIGPYIIKLLDVELYGIYNTVYAELQVFLIFASFGIYTYGVREISKIRNDKVKVSKLFSNLFLISLISNFIVCAIYLIYAVMSSKGITLTIYLITTIQFIGNTFYIEFINEALENYKFITLKTVIIKILYLVSIYLFLKNPNDIAIYALIVSLVLFFNNIISFIFAKKEIKFNFKQMEIKKYLKPLLTILIITNIDLLYSQLDRVMLGKFVDGVSVTMYYIPYYLISTLAAIPYSLINVSIPRLSYVIANEGKEEYEKQLNKIISSLLFVIVPMCLGVFVLAKEVIFIYAGEKYMSCVLTLMLACIIRIILSIESVFTNLVLYPNNKENKLLKISLTYGLLNLLLNSLLVIFNIFTPFTAMLTTGIAELLFTTTQYIYIRKKLLLNPKIFSKQNLTYFISSILFVVIAFLIKWINLGFYINILLIIALCIILYFIVLFIKKDENILIVYNKIKNILRRRKNG